MFYVNYISYVLNEWNESNHSIEVPYIGVLFVKNMNINFDLVIIASSQQFISQE